MTLLNNDNGNLSSNNMLDHTGKSMAFSYRVSIKDIAKAAGVSYSTVSRALNDSPLISQDVRDHIQEIANRWDIPPMH